VLVSALVEGFEPKGTNVRTRPLADVDLHDEIAVAAQAMLMDGILSRNFGFPRQPPMPFWKMINLHNNPTLLDGVRNDKQIIRSAF
jgi:hypothetical protein